MTARSAISDREKSAQPVVQDLLHMDENRHWPFHVPDQTYKSNLVSWFPEVQQAMTAGNKTL